MWLISFCAFFYRRPFPFAISFGVFGRLLYIDIDAERDDESAVELTM